MNATQFRTMHRYGMMLLARMRFVNKCRNGEVSRLHLPTCVMIVWVTYVVLFATETGPFTTTRERTPGRWLLMNNCHIYWMSDNFLMKRSQEVDGLSGEINHFVSQLVKGQWGFQSYLYKIGRARSLDWVFCNGIIEMPIIPFFWWKVGWDSSATRQIQRGVLPGQYCQRGIEKRWYAFYVFRSGTSCEEYWARPMERPDDQKRPFELKSSLLLFPPIGERNSVTWRLPKVAVLVWSKCQMVSF